jgi:arginyl-tRNA synthetase
MQAESWAYVLYTWARLNKLLNEPTMSSFGKGGGDWKEPEDLLENFWDILTEEIEFDIIKKISEFESVILQAHKDLAPHIICRYLLDLSKLLNSYYTNIKILSAPQDIRNARLYLVDKAVKILSKAMNLIWMQFIEKM